MDDQLDLMKPQLKLLRLWLLKDLVVTCSLLAACGGSNRSPDATTPAEPTTGSMTVGWVAPTTNADGSALTNLAGFRIYYGTAPGKYTNTVAVNDATATSYVVSNLPAGTYYLVVKAVNTASLESLASVEASKSIN